MSGAAQGSEGRARELAAYEVTERALLNQLRAVRRMMRKLRDESAGAGATVLRFEQLDIPLTGAFQAVVESSDPRVIVGATGTLDAFVVRPAGHTLWRHVPRVPLQPAGEQWRALCREVEAEELAGGEARWYQRGELHKAHTHELAAIKGTSRSKRARKPARQSDSHAGVRDTRKRKTTTAVVPAAKTKATTTTRRGAAKKGGRR